MTVDMKDIIVRNDVIRGPIQVPKTAHLCNSCKGVFLSEKPDSAYCPKLRCPGIGKPITKSQFDALSEGRL